MTRSTVGEWGSVKLTEPRASRWAGLDPEDRQVERRKLLIRACFELFGEGGEAAVSVRSVCRTADLNSRYFYESFRDTNELFGAVYDEIVIELGKILFAATREFPDDDRARLRAGIRAVLEFTSADPRRGKVLFAGVGANPAFVSRRIAAKDQLRRLIFTDRRRIDPQPEPMANEVEAVMYVGAMTWMTRGWAAGELGDDLDLVVDAAVRLLMPVVD
ncbi:MAG: TetR/AcrR family transcriptional regulator [Mycobacterium sp.]